MSSVAFSTKMGFPQGNGGSISPVFNVQTGYGAKGDSTTDDTTAIQNALNAAHTAGGGIVFFPSGTYMISAALQVYSYTTLLGGNRWFSQIKFLGTVGATTNMIQLASARQEQIAVRSLSLNGNAVGQHGVFIQNDSATNGAFASTFLNPRHRFEDLLICFFGGDGMNFAGDADGGACEVTGVQAYQNNGRNFYINIPDSVFTDCDSGQAGLQGFYNDGGYNRLVGCKSWKSGRITAASGYGFYEHGSGYTAYDACVAQDNQAHGYNFFGRSGIIGTLVADTNSASSAGTYFGVELQNATACDLVIVGWDRRPGGIGITQQYVADLSGATKNTVTVVAAQNSTGPLPVAQLNTDNNITASGVGVGGLANMTTLQLAKATPTYSASITPDTNGGPWQTITVTNTTAFTINAPGNAPGSGQTREITIEVLNSSGGTMGAITWNAAFVFAGATWTNPASTKKRFARFEWNGSAWVCTGVAAADY